MQTKGKTVQFVRKDMKLERKILENECKPMNVGTTKRILQKR